MDCKQSEIAMMQQMEKTIQPKTAKELAQHLLSCEPCRQMYLMFDQLMEYSTDDNLEIAPKDFTSCVMSKVNAFKAESKTSLAKKIVWAIGTILMGVLLFLISNPAIAPEFSLTVPTLNLQAIEIASISTAVLNFIYPLTQLEIQFDENLSVIALFFTIVSGIVLTILHMSENNNEHGVESQA